MARRRGVFVSGLAFVLVLSTGLFAQQVDKKQQEVLKKETGNLVKLADQAVAGQPAPNDLGLTWAHEDFMRSGTNKEFVPFTVTVDPSKVTGSSVALYWRVIPQAGAAPAPGQKKEDKKATFEGVSLVAVAPGAPMRINRSFVAPGGSYDVFIVMKEPAPDKAPKDAPPPKVSVLKHTITVPDFWNGELSTSTVIIYQRIEPLPTPLTPEQQAERPYAMGAAEIIPFGDLKLSKKSELSTFMFVYNPKADSASKPDIDIEYTFCQIAAGNEPKADEPCKAGEKFYNKTAPESLNAKTLDPQFDVKLHQLQAGQAVPLAGFPEGDYRLEIKVTDKLANKSIVQDVKFTVTS